MPDRFERLHVTGMTCTSCVARVEGALMAVAGVEHVHVDLKQGTAMVSGGDVLTLGALVQALIGEGYGVTSEAVAEAEASTDPSTITSAASFAPLLIAVALIGAGSLASGGADGFMARFMGGFFLVFGGLKLLDLRGFVSAYAMYDLLGARVTAYGWVYPFLEVGLGLAYLAVPGEANLHLATLGLMAFSSVGVILAVTRGEKLKCACMGTAFNLPMTTVTIVEDLGMAAMAAAMWLQTSSL
ncbi:MAG: cation transporter [Flavobacteriales bacterium]|nr:cation transporter [Flavobacteriales bacterium]